MTARQKLLARVWELQDAVQAAPEGSEEQERLRQEWLDAWQDYKRKSRDGFFGPEC